MTKTVELFEIYKLTNTVNNKSYIGQTKKGRTFIRWQEHIAEALRGARTCLCEAIRKYGPSNFEISIIATDILKDKIDFAEGYYIKFFNTFFKNGCGYNMTLGGQGIRGYVFTEADRAKLGLGVKKFWTSLKETNPDRYALFCEQRRLNMTGRKFSDEHRKKLSVQAAKRTGPKNSFFGKHFSKESKQKLIEAHRSTSQYAICQYDLHTGQFIKSYKLYTDIIRELSLTDAAVSRISLICKAGKGHAYGYIWRWKSLEYDESSVISDEELVYENRKAAHVKAICQLTLDHILIRRFDSTIEAARAVSPADTTYAQLRATAAKLNRAATENIDCFGFFWNFPE